MRVTANGTVSLGLVKMIGATETVFTSTRWRIDLRGQTDAQPDSAGHRENLTSVKVKAWQSVASQPLGWRPSSAEPTGSLQAPGLVGRYTFS